MILMVAHMLLFWFMLQWQVFDEFHKKFIKYLNEYEFPYLRETDIVDVDTDYTEIKHVQTILKRTDKRVRVHFFTVHIN